MLHYFLEQASQDLEYADEVEIEPEDRLRGRAAVVETEWVPFRGMVGQVANDSLDGNVADQTDAITIHTDTVLARDTLIRYSGQVYVITTMMSTEACGVTVTRYTAVARV